MTVCGLQVSEVEAHPGCWTQISLLLCRRLRQCYTVVQISKVSEIIFEDTVYTHLTFTNVCDKRISDKDKVSLAVERTWLCPAYGGSAPRLLQLLRRQPRCVRVGGFFRATALKDLESVLAQTTQFLPRLKSQ